MANSVYQSSEKVGVGGGGALGVMFNFMELVNLLNVYGEKLHDGISWRIPTGIRTNRP